MAGIKQSFVYDLFTQEGQSIKELLEFAGRTGFAAVEAWFLGENKEEFVSLARSAGLAVASFIGHHGPKTGLNDPANHDEILEELRKNIEFARKHEIPGLICLAGYLEPDADENIAIDAVVAGLCRVKTAAEKAGVNLNLELLNSKVDHEGFLLDNTLAGVEIIKRVDSPNVKLLYDIYHMQIMEGDLIRTIQENIQFIGHFHTAGVPGRHELDDQQEINYPAVMKAIASSGYDLYVGHEFIPRSPDKTESLAQAFNVCNMK